MPFTHPESAGPSGWMASLSKRDLEEWCDRLMARDATAIELCVAFVEKESTQCLWHGRARAKMCRRLKHVSLSQRQSERLVTAVLQRLQVGVFSEQFRDQLRLAVLLDPKRVESVARSCLGSPRPHFVRLAKWVWSSGGNR